VPSVREIRGRIKSVKNTARVTGAMQMVAASKMRRAQEQVIASRPYSQKLRVVLAGVAAQGEGVAGGDESHPLLQSRPVRNILLLEITPDRGLAGGLPSNINRASGRFMQKQNSPASAITVGRKGREFMVRAGQTLQASFPGLGERPTLSDCLPISALIAQLYTDGVVDEVHIAYTRFINTLFQEPVVAQLLPIKTDEFEELGSAVDYEYEPDAETVLNALVPRFLDTQVYQAVLESNASEQSARMVSMRNATDAAEEMVDSLTLELNKARQAMITAELLDLVGGVAALEG
jgi:F-type H+-transporting ATPase subunit gamma